MIRKYLLFLLIVFVFQGCGIIRIAFNNIGDSITSEPRKVEKIKNPIHDSVKISVLWAGHSTSLIQIYDKVILLDPLFNKRIGGLLMRKTETGLDYENLKRLDYIFISHSHIDHLSLSSLKTLEEKFPDAKLIFPKGVENFLPDYKFDMIRIDNTESQYKNYIGKSINIGGMKVTPVFAMHTGGRYGFDVYTWKEQGATGYIIEYKDVVFYYAGDTGYHDKAFKKIGENFKIDVSLIPIGPCRNCDSTGFWHHTSSIEALKLFEDVKAKYMIPVHYGAVRYMSDENTPLYTLNKIINDSASMYYYLRDKIKPLKIGEQIIWKEE